MEAGLPEDDSDLAREGKLLHDYSAHSEYERKVLTPQQQDLIAIADDRTKTAIATIERENDLTGKEFNVFLERIFSSNEISGTPDYVRQYKSEILVVDRKFGYLIVDTAELNLQLRVYAVVTWIDDHIKNSFVAIVQPRAPYDQRLTIAHYTPEDIEASREQILEILDESNKSDAPLIPGEEQCRYCKAKLICPAFRESMMIPAVLTPDNTLSKTAREAYLAQRIAELSDEQLEKVVESIRLASFVHEPALDEARSRIVNGKMENFRLGKESSVRQIISVRRAIALLSLAGMNKEDIFDAVNTMSLTDLSNALRKRHPTWSEKETREWIDKKLSSVIELQSRKPRVIRK